MVATHNSPRDMQGQRNASTETEARLVNTLEASGKPVLLVGDFNEHESFFCRIAARTNLVSANGGRYAGGCVPPPGPVRIDWLLGSAGLVDFSGYHQDGATLAERMSDHYLVYATAQLTMPLDPPPAEGRQRRAS
jgi:endonuclease/exonuclease/phosphatase family metal-dependent hydrolase